MTSTFEPMESLLGSLQVQRPSRARGRQGKVPMLPILLMTGAIVGCMFLLASLLNVGPVPDTNFFVQRSDGQRRVLNQRQGGGPTWGTRAHQLLWLGFYTSRLCMAIQWIIASITPRFESLTD